MQILTKTGTRNINFIPREAISGAKVYKLVIKSEGQNKVILTDNAATFTELDYYFQYSTTQACLLYTSPSPRDGLLSRMPSSA